MRKTNALLSAAAMAWLALVLSACSTSASDLRSALAAYDEGTEENERIRARVLQAIEDGADPSLNYAYLTPLSVAIEMEDQSFVAALIEAGANVQAGQVDADGDLLTPPLFEAVQTGDSTIVELLLEAGASIVPLPDEDSALDIAIHGRHQEIVELLLDREPSPEVLSQALLPALQTADERTLERLLQAGATYDSSMPLLASAVYGGSPRLVERMLAFSYGADQVEDAYEAAANNLSWGHDERPHAVEVMRLLLQSSHRASSRAMDAALRSAIEARNVEAIELLLEHDAPVNGHESSMPPLVAIARSAVFDPLENAGSSRTVAEEIGLQVKLAQLLLDKGADVDAVDKHERSALIWAAVNLNADLVEKLLRSGADPSLIDRAGKTAKQHASERRPTMPSSKDKPGQAAVAMFGLGPLIERRQRNADRILALLESSRASYGGAPNVHKNVVLRDNGPTRRETEDE